jgi:NhaA family Na+:H+ antiporter
MRNLLSSRAAVLPRRVAQPLQEFLRTESAGGVLLLAAAVAALAWANAPFGETYGDVWGTHVAIHVGRVSIDDSLQQWINDGLMAIFFFVVGLEVKRETVRGELSQPRQAALPVAAALGGMMAPALIYLALNAGGSGERGWGIPMATDIAFAAGVVALAGPRVPSSLRAFLLALAIVDDIGAIIIIAIFYSGAIDFAWLAAAAGFLAVAAVLGRAGLRPPLVYLLAGTAAWLATYESGVHPTIAGVALGLLTPAGIIGGQRAVDATPPAPSRTADGDREGADRGGASVLDTLSGDEQPLLDRMERALHPWSSFVIVPLFALANAGIAVDATSVRAAVHSPISIGVALGLVIGKPAGILLASWLGVRLGMAALPSGVAWQQLAAAAVVAGIGFTVSLFITDLAFTDPRLISDAKMGIIGGSLAMGIAGYVATGAAARRDRYPLAR